MAQRQEDFPDPLLYERYLTARRRYGEADDDGPSPGHVIRQCHACGQRAMFRLDPEGVWYECLHCGHLA
jgi:hypothetical protein